MRLWQLVEYMNDQERGEPGAEFAVGHCPL